MNRIAYAMIAFLNLGCLDQGFKSLTEPNREGTSSEKEPAISVSPSVLDFGMHLSSDPAVQRVLRIVNVGEGTLEVEPLVIGGETSNAFSWVQPPQAQTLQPQAEFESILLFTAVDSFQEATVSIASNDPNSPIIDVPLFGLGAYPDLALSPNPLNMGNTGVGCQLDNEITLLNQGLEDLVVINISNPMLPEFQATHEYTFPLTIPSGQSEVIEIAFVPTDILSYADQIHVESNDPTTPIDTLFLSGEGDAVWQEESFVVSETPKSDILFSVDLSSSMSDEQVALGQQFETFITELSNLTNDWQVMVVNADHGCNHSGILTENTPDYADLFLTAVQTGAYDISFTEALLTAVANGVEKTDPGECNAGFLRPNAMLHIIMLSDECEQSPNPGICGTQWQDYVNRITNQKGDPNLVRMSAVAGDFPNGCSTTGLPNSQTAEFGSGYYESSLATGGLFISICSDWTDPLYLQQLASASVSQASYELAHTPVEHSIQVSIDGIPQSTGWVYDPLTNSIELDVQPPAFSTVTLSYYSLPSCSN